MEDNLIKINLQNSLKGSMNCSIGFILGIQPEGITVDIAERIELAKTLVSRGYNVYVTALRPDVNQ